MGVNNEGVQLSLAKIQARRFFHSRIDIFEEEHKGMPYVIMTMPSDHGYHEADILRNRFYKNEDYKRRVKLVTVDRRFHGYSSLGEPGMRDVAIDTLECHEHVRGEVNTVYDKYAKDNLMIAWMDLESGPTEENVAKILANLKNSKPGSRIYVTFVVNGRDGGDKILWVGGMQRYKKLLELNQLSEQLGLAIQLEADELLQKEGGTRNVSLAILCEDGVTRYDMFAYEHILGKLNKCVIIGLTLNDEMEDTTLELPEDEAVGDDELSLEALAKALKTTEEIRELTSNRQLLLQQELNNRQKLEEAKQAVVRYVEALVNKQYPQQFNEPFPMGRILPKKPEGFITQEVAERKERKLAPKKQHREVDYTSFEDIFEHIATCIMEVKQQWLADGHSRPFPGVYKRTIVNYLAEKGITKTFQYISSKMVGSGKFIRTPINERSYYYNLKE